jgi:hypothetical protein
LVAVLISSVIRSLKRVVASYTTKTVAIKKTVAQNNIKNDIVVLIIAVVFMKFFMIYVG